MGDEDNGGWALKGLTEYSGVLTVVLILVMVVAAVFTGFEMQYTKVGADYSKATYLTVTKPQLTPHTFIPPDKLCPKSQRGTNAPLFTPIASSIGITNYGKSIGAYKIRVTSDGFKLIDAPSQNPATNKDEGLLEYTYALGPQQQDILKFNIDEGETLPTTISFTDIINIQENSTISKQTYNYYWDVGDKCYFLK